MEGYKVFFKKSVEKDFKAIPQDYLSKILIRIEDLQRDSRPHGSEKITGQGLNRIRQGTFRIVYTIQDNELTIWAVKVAHRNEIYKKIS